MTSLLAALPPSSAFLSLRLSSCCYYCPFDPPPPGYFISKFLVIYIITSFLFTKGMLFRLFINNFLSMFEVLGEFLSSILAIIS
jgi:hypothetical protein